MDNQETKGAAVEEKGCCSVQAKCCGGKGLAALALAASTCSQSSV